MSDDGAVDVQKFLNEHRFSGFQWLIFALCFAIVFLDGYCRYWLHRPRAG